MAEVIKEFLVGLGFGIDKTGLSNFTAGIGKATAATAAIGAAFVGAAVGFTAFVSGVAKEEDAISDLAIRTNSTATEIQRLGYVAGLTDGSLDAVKTSIDGLAKAAGAAFMGEGEFELFKKLGINLKSADGKLRGTTDLLSEVGQKIKDFDRGKQIAILEKLGIDKTMIQAITGDVSALTAEFDQLYGVAGIDADKAAQASSDFQDQLGKLTFVFDTLKKAVALRFMGQLGKSLDTLRKFIVNNIPKIVDSITPVINFVLRTADAFVALAARIVEWGAILIGWLGRANDATDGWAGYILAAAAAWQFLNLAFLATPIGMILALAAAIAILVDDFMTFKEGGDSLIDWSKWEPGINLAIEAVKIMSDAFISSIRAMIGIVDVIVKLITGDFSGAWTSLMGVFDNLLDYFSNTLAAIWKMFDAISAIAGPIKSLLGIDSDEAAVANAAANAAAVGQTGGGAPALTPSPATAAAISGREQTINQQTQIVVQGSDNPQATAAAVSGAQYRVNADMARNMSGAAR